MSQTKMHMWNCTTCDNLRVNQPPGLQTTQFYEGGIRVQNFAPWCSATRGKVCCETVAKPEKQGLEEKVEN